METFLGKVAAWILENYPDNTANLTIVFPNRRAGIFLKNEFQKRIQKDIWLPKIVSLEEALSAWTGYQLADGITIRLELLKIHHEMFPDDPKSIGDFAGYSELFASDFDEIDQYLTDAENLFGILTESKALELWHIDGTQLTASEQQFLEFYRSIGLCYKKLKSRLLDKKIAYQGMLARLLAETPENQLSEIMRDELIVFAGFNALTPAEEKIMLHLEKAGKAVLLWDIDKYFLERNAFNPPEAGLFMRKFFEKHPRKLEIRWISDQLLSSRKKIRIIGVPGNAGQCKVLGNNLLKTEITDEKTAVILADENLLIPAISSIPEQIGKFNLTMGLPFSKSVVYRFIRKLLDFHLQESDESTIGNYSNWQLIRILQHEFIKILLSETENKIYLRLIQQLIKSPKNSISNDEFVQLIDDGSELLNFYVTLICPWKKDPLIALKQLLLLVESAYQIFIKNEHFSSNILFINQINAAGKLLKRLSDLISTNPELVDLRSLLMLINQLAPSYPVSFYGEPLSGMQVMGLLETRNLDFKTIHMLSVNEGVLPADRRNNSFIPHDIRRLTGLPDYAHKQAVFAYHFFRLLQSADEINLYYNTESDAFGGGEKSRFIMQISRELAKLNPLLDIEEIIETLPLTSGKISTPISIEKTPDILAKVSRKAISGFSASSLSNYLTCPLRFVLSDVLGIREPEMDDELIAANTIGNILHKALENLYENNKNQPIKVDCYKNSDRILLDAFRSVTQSAVPEFGKNKLIFEVIHKLWNDFVRNEKKLIEDGNILIIKDLEAEYFVMSEISQNGISIPWKLKGKIDRIDNLNGETRIIDFKTGKVIDTDLKINNLNINELTSRPKAFQLIIYTYLMQNNVQGMDISFNMAGVYKLLRTTSGIIPLQIKDGNCSASEIKTILDSIVNEIFNPELEFNQTTETDACKYCAFKDLCERSSKDRN